MKTTILFLGYFVFLLNVKAVSLDAINDNVRASTTVGCAPLSVSFSSPLTNVTSYRWNFGNGETSTLPSPVILYQNAGTYDVSLSVTYASGQSEDITLPEFIHVKSEPVADFSILATDLCLGEESSFTNSSSGANTYIWDFGDGANSTDENPVHTYTKAGVYSVTLISFNAFGCSGVKIVSDAITVRGVENLSFDADIKQTCLESATITFTPADDYASYLWDFGDGSMASVKSPTHTYQTAGKYDVSLTVTGESGCAESIEEERFIDILPPPQIEVEWTNDVACAGQRVDFRNLTPDTDTITWTFSDGYTTSDEEFSRVFSTINKVTFTVQLTDFNGCTSTKTFYETIDIRDADSPNITFSETEGCAPFTVRFENNTADATSYVWEVNGLQFTDQSFDYTFSRRGVYSILARTQHANGCESVVPYDSIIIVNDPVIVASANAYRGCEPMESTFKFNTDLVSDILWDFGDGNFSNSKTPVNVYSTPGTYEVKVSFINEFGCAKTLSLPRPIEVNEAVIDYQSTSIIEACLLKEISFFGGVGRDFWEWDFGDGNTSVEPNPKHKYSEPGVYDVSLKTNNANGCSSLISNHSQVTVQDTDFSFSHTLIDSTACPKFTLQFMLPANDYESVQWSFGDGSFSNEVNPTHEYTSVTPHVVSVTITNSSGCSRTKAAIVTSPWAKCTNDGPDNDDPLDDPDGDPDDLPTISYVHIIKSCSAPFELSLTNPRPSALSWQWDFGDGNGSIDQNPTHTYQNTGEYVINLLAKSASGETDSVNNYISVKIYSQNVDFTYTENPACEGVEVAFSNVGGAQVSWNWNFGDSTSSILQNPRKNFTKEGMYPVALVSRDTLGCVATVIKNVIIGNAFPQFSYSETICANDTFSISHNLVGFTEYIWDYGDGSFSTGTDPEHIYQQIGEYKVKLTTIDEFGCEDYYDLPQMVIVNQPSADFKISGETGSCNSLRVLFRNLSTNAERWLWDFGNGQTSTLENPTMEFFPGTYSVSLTSYFDGCSDTIVKNNLIQVDSLQADFSFVWDKSCLPAPVQFYDGSNQAVSWLWDFGDGRTSEEQNPVHVYTKFPVNPVTLKVESAQGCVSRISRDLPAFTETNFSGNSTKGCVPHTVDFRDKSNQSVGWWWDFGDGSTSIEQHPSHEYTATGAYDIRLITKSTTGCYDTLMVKSYIEIGDLSVDFEASNEESLCTPLVVRFESLSEGATSFLWDFGDGKSSSQENPTHVYSTVGNFDVTLIASNEFGCQDSITYTNLITSLGPQAGFTMSDTAVCHPQAIQFTDLSVSAVEWQWFFGDGGVSNEQNPVHEYAEPGSYDVSLLARDINGCDQLVVFRSINVYPQPIADFDIEEFDACQPATLSLVNKSVNLQNHQFQWDFGNGTVSNQVTPELKYNIPGSYEISLTVTNEGTCSDTYVYNEEIVVRDTFHLEEPDILQLSVTEEQDLLLLRAPYLKNNYKYEVVFRRAYGQTEFQIIDTIYNPLDSIYIDTQVKAYQNSYEYKLQSFVFCNDTVELASLNTYQSIYMTSEAQEEGISLKWTPYKGHEFDGYAIMRKSSRENWVEIAELPKEQHEYTDTEELCPLEYTYRVEARNLNNTRRNSNSNLRKARPIKNIFLDQKVEILRSTVVEEKILTEWLPPIVGPDKVVYYELWRSENEMGFQLIEKIPNGITSYMDENTNPALNNYIYKVDIINTCKVNGPESNISSNILLQKETKGYINRLYWNPYQQWGSGVLEYRLQKRNERGEWQTTDLLPPEQHTITIDLRDE